ncbi:MAG: hypothetical protein FJX77_16145, partial [Armatimonadetes bacterium]|nr:hypothetical protein [Armatimonadota bacterium]
FCYGFTFQSNFKANEEPLADWEECIGSRPPDVTTLVRHGDDLFFGATDGKLRMQRLDRLGQEGPIVLLDAGPNFIMNSPPAVTEEVVVAAAGALDLRQKFVKRSASERLAIGGGAAVLGALLTRSPLGAIAGGILGSRGGNKEVLRIDGEGLLVGLNRRNNAVQWTIETGYAGNPVVHENRAFIGGMGERACIQLQDGREAWRTGVRKGNEAEFYHIGYAGSLGILGITVPVEPRKTDNGNIEILGDKEVRVEKYDPNTGAVVWKVEIGDVRKRRQVLGASLTVDEKKGILYAVAAQLVAAVDVNTGKLLWSYDHGKAMAELQKKSKDKLIQGVNFSPQIAVQDGVIYVGSEDRKLYAINAQDGKQLWVYNARGPVSHPVFQEGRIYVGSGDGQFHVVDARTGELAWRVRLGSPVISPPLLWEGLAFVATASGDLQTIRLPIA